MLVAADSFELIENGENKGYHSTGCFQDFPQGGGLCLSFHYIHSIEKTFPCGSTCCTFSLLEVAVFGRTCCTFSLLQVAVPLIW